MLYFFQQVLNGLHSGALYALLAFGYVLTNGILHRTNLAYGAVFAFCGQTMILTAAFGYQTLWLTLFASVALGVVAALLYAALISHVLSRSVFEPLADRSPNAIVVTTLGILLVLSEASRIAADTHDLWLPPMLAQPIIFARSPTFTATLTLIQVLDCAFVLAIIAFCHMGLHPVELRPALARRIRRPQGSRHVRGRRARRLSWRGAGRQLVRGAGRHAGRPLLRQCQFRHGSGVRVENPVRDRRSAAISRRRGPPLARLASVWANRFGPAISRSNGATPGCTCSSSPCCC